MMKSRIVLLSVAFCLCFLCAQGFAQSHPQTCPVLLTHIELSYNHAGGHSVPQLRLSFDNKAGRNISTVTFGLSILDSGGYPHPYPDDLTYRDGLEAAAKKLFTWQLDMNSVDIHRTGETVTVQKVEFADGTNWADDGSESCMLTFDFHPK